MGLARSGNAPYPGFGFVRIREEPFVGAAVMRFVLLDFRSVLVAMHRRHAPDVTLTGNHELIGFLFKHRNVPYFPPVIRQRQRHDGPKMLVRFQVQSCEAMQVHEDPERTSIFDAIQCFVKGILPADHILFLQIAADMRNNEPVFGLPVGLCYF